VSAPKNLREITDDDLHQRLAEAGGNVHYSVNDLLNESSRREMVTLAKHAKQAADRASWTAAASSIAAVISAIAAVVAIVLSMNSKTPACSYPPSVPPSASSTHAP
jgi:hypothetical protein